jgi:thiamine-phosphate pyrophosphorylase
MIGRVMGITPGDDGHPRNLEWLMEGAVRGGLRWLVLREPEMDTRAYITLARRLSPMLSGGVILHARHPAGHAFARSGGWGLHVPSGTDLRAARASVDGVLGVSCHNAQDIANAVAVGADYVTISPVFQPVSKPDDIRIPFGVNGLIAVIENASIPVFALGGITPENAALCRAAGAHGVATMGSLFRPDATPESCRDEVLTLGKQVGQERIS